MTKLYIHAQTLIDGISDAPKQDQLITIEDDKIIQIEDYHEVKENVIHEKVVTQDSLIVTSILCIRLVLAQIKNLP